MVEMIPITLPLPPGFVYVGQDMLVKKGVNILFRQGRIKTPFERNRNPGLTLTQTKTGFQFHPVGKPMFCQKLL
jgi:hypothetical protein